MLEKLQNSNAYVGSFQRKTVGGFPGREREQLIGKGDSVIGSHKKDLGRREEENKKEKDTKTTGMQIENPAKEALFSAQNLLANGTVGSAKFQELNIQKPNETVENIKHVKKNPDAEMGLSQDALARVLGNRGKAPYSILADKNGIIEYNGVILQCDFEKNALCWGDMNDLNNVLNIPLSHGGRFMVHRDNIDDLKAVIGMFEPADVTRIMSAIYQDNKNRGIQQEIDEDTSALNLVDPSQEDNDNAEVE